MLLLTKNRSVTSYRMLAFRVVFEYLQVRGRDIVLFQLPASVKRGHCPQCMHAALLS
jgi:hypothetical protein